MENDDLQQRQDELCLTEQHGHEDDDGEWSTTDDDSDLDSEEDRFPWYTPGQDRTLYLKKWHREYMAREPSTLFPSDELIQAIHDDCLNMNVIRREVRRSMSCTTVSQGLCNLCRRFSKVWRDVKFVVTDEIYHSSNIEAGMRKGCRSCCLVRKELECRGLWELLRKLEARLVLVTGSRVAASLTHEELLPAGDEKATLTTINFPGLSTYSSVAQRSTGLVTLRSEVIPPPIHLQNYGDTFRTARAWLKSCCRDHSVCVETRITGRPSRLLCIAHNSIKLVTTADWNTMPHYATLSYCWGSAPFLKLTSQNVTRFMDHISEDELPQTFRDAIITARRLDIEYIWIDALCIKQDTDHRGEWAIESSLMHDIYGGSYLNIAAATAYAAHEGCLVLRSSHSSGLVVRMQGTEVCTYHRVLPDLQNLRWTSYSPLGRRAWALQERLLAPRTLFFGYDSVYWECRALVASIDLPGGCEDEGSLRPLNMTWDWPTIVEDYSSTALSRPGDKLPALSGIARRQQELTGDEYLAGLWRSTLPEAMVWRSIEFRPRPEWRAPTWSWAAVEGQVSFIRRPTAHELGTVEYLIEVLDASTRPAHKSSDGYGALLDGRLQVACIGLVHGGVDYRNQNETAWGADQSVNVDGVSESLAVRLDCRPSPSWSNHVWFLPILKGYDEVCGTKYIRGILLQHDESTHGTFRRLAWFGYSQRPDEITVLERPVDWSPILYDRFMHSLASQGAATAEAECIQVRSLEHETFRYVINLV